MFLILTKMSNFCITEHNAGVLLRISPLKFNYDPAECSHGLQNAACLWQSLTWIWNNFICLCQYIFFLRVLSACFPMVSSIFPLCSIPCQSVWLPSSQISLSVCFHATLRVIHSKDILWFPSYSILACSQYPSPKFAVVFLQVLLTFSGYSVFRLPVCIHVQPIFLW